MATWPLNRRFNFIDRGDEIEIVHTPDILTVEKGDELVVSAKPGDITTFNTSRLGPGDRLTFTEQNGARSTYVMKHPGIEEALELERALSLTQ
jgi:hypothetical protein